MSFTSAILVRQLYPIGRALFPAAFCTLKEVGQAIIHAAKSGYPKKILEGKDIIALAKQA